MISCLLLSYNASAQETVQSNYTNAETDAAVLKARDSMITNAKYTQAQFDSSTYWTTPEMFGAVGNGVTDDTEELQAAIDYWGTYGTAWTHGGGYVYLKAKTYLISNKITIRNNIKIIGAGSDQGTRILLKDHADNIGTMIEIGIRNSSNPISVDLEGFKIEMDAESQDYDINNITTYNYLRHCNFRDLFVFEATSKNLYMTFDVGYSKAHNNYFYSCAFENSDSVGVDATFGYNLNFLNCYFGFVRGAVGKSLKITGSGSTDLHIDHCWFLQNVTSYNSIYLTGTIERFTVTNNTFIPVTANGAAGSAQITTDANIKDGIIAGNVIGGGNTYVMRLNSAVGLVVRDNLLGVGSTSQFYTTGGQIIEGNYDYSSYKPQEKYGVDTLQIDSTAETITHGIYTTPNYVQLTPEAGETIWVSDINATTFKVNRASGTNKITFYWTAKKRY